MDIICDLKDDSEEAEIAYPYPIVWRLTLVNLCGGLIDALTVRVCDSIGLSSTRSMIIYRGRVEWPGSGKREVRGDDETPTVTYSRGTCSLSFAVLFNH